ncbi:Craniofacial development protein 2 [Eumeta japonica]|uniref:Craniofacial development protein 2 n=1 Tax=Eumeta variegata TaxID=151549 RepID=A0A4C1WIE0_EUMVA|nr:Craniofacial development protein 2 [Eumeta japonica]
MVNYSSMFPTESNKKQDIEKIENFYSDLQATIQKSYKNIILMGDFNGQVGVSNSGEEFTIGRHDYGKRTKNGERLVSFAMENKLRILSTFYNRKSSRNWTWISPNGLYKNEVDFIMSNNSKVIQNLSVIDQLNFNSDHRMVRATLTAAYVKKNRRFQNKANNLPCLGDNDKPLRNLRASADSTEQNTTIQEKYNNFLNLIRTETTRINKEDKMKVLSLESKQHLEQRKEIVRKGKECIESRQKIRSLSKQINVSIRRDRKGLRLTCLGGYLEQPKNGRYLANGRIRGQARIWVLCTTLFICYRQKVHAVAPVGPRLPYDIDNCVNVGRSAYVRSCVERAKARPHTPR